jgi:dUTP pyrophosphatase
MIKIKFKKLRDTASVPQYQTEQAAGMDLCSAEHLLLWPGRYRLVKTGLSIELPMGVEAQIRPRSGLAMKRGVTVLNAPGTIDSDYRGEVGVLLINHGQDVFDINVGERIAQIVFAHVFTAKFELAEDLSSTQRGEGGFGSTGA